MMGEVRGEVWALEWSINVMVVQRIFDLIPHLHIAGAAFYVWYISSLTQASWW
jgi:hypothetical protein